MKIFSIELYILLQVPNIANSMAFTSFPYSCFFHLVFLRDCPKTSNLIPNCEKNNQM